MPELPEVQTIIYGLQILINNKITNFKIYTSKLRYLIPRKIVKMAQNRKIIKIYRKAKYIIIELDHDISLIFHLGMSGRLSIVKLKNYRRQKHDHVLVYLDKNILLIFNDQRKFGLVDFSNTHQLNQNKYFNKLGLDPFAKSLNNDYLLNKFKHTKSSIKKLLLDQHIISGIGNIYANEILFDAKISPFVPGSELKITTIRKLLLSIKKILKKALKYGGTSIRDYINIDGSLGKFQSKFKVYNKEGKKISNFVIYRAKQDGRSTFYCPDIQKSKFNPKKEN